MLSDQPVEAAQGERGNRDNQVEDGLDPHQLVGVGRSSNSRRKQGGEQRG